MSTQLRRAQRFFYSADDLFDLVSDVRHYPNFIHQITAMRVTDETRTAHGFQLKAEARVRYKFVTERFTTVVHADENKRTIEVEFVSGPFRKLENNWRFHALSDGSCLVEFYINAAFRNPVLQMLLDSNRERAVSVLISRFQDEAKRRYTPTGDPSVQLDDEIHALQQ
ncbi:type II toxin-antitoxin system RatA family toxin [Maricaulis sp. D1M11]|uniref:type II toxin-antitoxin system RatA family toxin n=1 Tax=Maricaulis sp. D1M11 TaxID=3076117 RepID=UPI0039B3A09E